MSYPTISCKKQPIRLAEWVMTDINRLLYKEHGVGLSDYLRSLRGRRIMKDNDYNLDYDNIIQRVYEYFGVPVKNHERRLMEYRTPRQVSIYFGKMYTTLSLRQLAAPFGKDHATAYYSIGVINDLKETDRKFRQQLGDIEDIILNGYGEVKMESLTIREAV